MKKWNASVWPAMLLLPLVASLLWASEFAVELCWASTVQDKQIAEAMVNELRKSHAKASHNLLPAKPLRIAARPGCLGNVGLEVYELTEAQQFRFFEALVLEAQKSVPGVATVGLRFYEREVWVSSEGGGGHRGQEKLLHEISLTSLRGQGPIKGN